MPILYNFGIYLLAAFYWVAGLFHPKAREWRRGRKHWRRQLARALADCPKDQPRIWIHCASLGEFEQGRPLIEKMKQEHPHVWILLTFFSPSGYLIRREYAQAAYVMYLPLDRPANARDFLNLVQPDVGIFVKYEFWWNFITSAKNQSIPLVLIAGLFRSQHYLFSWYGSWYRQQLSTFAHFYLQNQSSAEVLEQHGISQFSVVGDPRVDRVLQIASEVKPYPKVEKWRADRPTLVIGSSWPPDEKLLFAFFAETLPADWCVILAPHDISRRHIQQIEKKLTLSFQKYSDLEKGKMQSSRVLIIDNIGMLSGLYQYGRLAYIGGGFGAGIHNTLEPMAFRLPLIFGPHFEKFEEAIYSVQQGGAFTIHNLEELNSVFSRLQSPSAYRASQRKVSAYLQQSRDATDRILTSLEAQEFLQPLA